MSAPPRDFPVSLSTSGFEDGLGRRTLVFDREAGTMLERLRLRPELNAFEAALRKRIARVDGFDDERFARVREIERDPATGGLTVVSEFVSGYRFSDLLEAAVARPGDEDAPGLDVALGFLLEVLPALVALHGIAGFTHGALGPGRTILTPSGQVVLLDCIFGETLQRLQFTRTRLWREFRTALPPTPGPARFDVAADLAQVSVMAMMLVVGRPLSDHEYPDGLVALMGEVVEIAQIRGSATFARAIEQFLQRTVPVKSQRAFGSADEAASDVRSFTQEIGLLQCRLALRTFISRMSGAETPAPAKRAAKPASSSRRVERPAVAHLDLELPLDLGFETTPAVVAHLSSRAVEEPVPEAIAEEPIHFSDPVTEPEAIDIDSTPIAFVEETPEAVSWDEPAPAFEPAVFADAAPAIEEPAPAMEPFAAIVEEIPVFEAAAPEPEAEYVAVVEEAPAYIEAAAEVDEPILVVEHTPVVDETPVIEEAAFLEAAPIVEEPPIVEEAPVVEEPAVVEEPSVYVHEEPAPIAVAAAPVPEPPPAAVKAPEPPPAVESKRKRGSVRKSKRDKLRSVAAPPPAPVKATPPPAPMPVHYAPPPPAAPIPMPVHYSPANSVPMPSYAPMPAPSWQPAAPVAIAAQPVAPAPLPASAPVRIKATPPAGYVPPAVRVDAREPFAHTHRSTPRSSGGFPWKFAAAAVILVLVGVGVGAGRQYLPGRKPTTSRTTADAAKTAAPAKPAEPVSDTGTLVIATQPAGAKVLIDGKPAGESPLTVDAIAVGHHVLTFVTGSGSIRKPIRIEADKTLSVDVPVYSGWVAVFSPIRLDIAEKGQSIGSTDQGRLMLSPGTHTLTLSNREYSYTSVQSVIIESGEERAITVRPRGSVSFNASPWAEVWVDGEKMGETPLANLQLMLGTRNVVFKHPQFGERRTTAIITATSPTVISIDFTKPPRD